MTFPTPDTRPHRGRRWVARAVGIGVIAAFWAGYALTDRDRGPGRLDEEAAAILSSPDQDWQIENLYLTSPERLTDTTARIHRLPGRDADFTILAVGDSYTYGFGLTDRQAAWPGRLHRELTSRGYDVDVVNLSQPGASLFTYQDWFEAISQCREGGPCDGFEDVAEFDAVIIGFYANDFTPSPGDSVLEGQAPVAANRDQWSPYEPRAGDAAQRIVMAAGVPVYWMPLAGIGSNETSDDASVNWDPGRWWQLLEPSGMQQVAPTHALSTVEAGTAEDLMVNPVDYHPSPTLHHAYARDAADAVTAILTVDDGTRRSAGPAIRDALPAVELVDDGQHLTVSYQPNPRWLCTGLDRQIVQARLHWTDLPVEAFSCNSDGRPEVLLHGERRTLPYQPCAELGRPHVELFLDSHVTGDGAHLLRSDSQLYGRTVTYDDGRRTISEPVDLTLGIALGPDVESVLVHGAGRPGCGEDREAVPAFTLTLES